MLNYRNSQMNDSSPPNSIRESSSLRSQLNFTPQELKFGTSGRRGLVTDLSQLEIYINVLGELLYLRTLDKEKGGIRPGEPFYVATDLRPSSTQFVPEQQGRGELTQAVLQAVTHAGMNPVFLGEIPTPALTFYALERQSGSIMVTGSHIPFDRNGYKTNTSIGELLKDHEQPIASSVLKSREQTYNTPFDDSLFDEAGRLKCGHQNLPLKHPGAEQAYICRYSSFFDATALQGLRILVYEHSAVGRDIVRQVLQELGAEVISAGRSDEFVPIDTENIDAEQLKLIQALADRASKKYGPLDAVVSVDGDSDRPLLLGIEPSAGQVSFFAGDLVGMIVAEYLGADAIVVPISCNDAVDRGTLASKIESKTRIGSPFVIVGIDAAKAKGKNAVCGWEANGGFLLGSDLYRGTRVLRALPTRDALLPIVCTLISAREKGLTIPDLFSRLPKRFSRAALLKNFPRPVAAKIIARFSPADPTIKEIDFSGLAVPDELLYFRDQLSPFFPADAGFIRIVKLNYLDGARITFDNGDVVHVRPSGNADELRVYAVADSQQRAEEIVALAIAEPDGILRRLAQAVEVART
jgi:phosphomannomutase